MRRALFAAAAPLAVAAVAATAGGCRRGAGPSAEASLKRIEELRTQNDKLREELHQQVAADPVIKQFSQIVDPVIVAIRPSMVERVIKEVTYHYLDQVQLHMRPNIHVNYSKDIEKKTFLGKVKGGTLKVSIDVLSIKGRMLSKEPVVTFAGANRLDLVIPVRVDQGAGAADFAFEWDSAGLANLVCKDFTFKDKLDGTVVAFDYPLRGGFLLSATSSAIIASPVFPEQKFRLRLDLTPASWARVRRAVEGQDSFGKCGVALDPPKIMAQLEQLGQRGFDVKLPKSLIRTVTLPANVEQEVNVQDNIVALSVKPGVLSLDKDTLVFSSAVTTSVAAMSIRPQPAKTPGRRKPAN